MSGGATSPSETEAPEEPGGSMRTISASIQLVWGVRVVIGSLGVAVVVGFASGLVDVLPAWSGPAVGLALGIVGLVWVRLRYRRWAFEIRAAEVYLERGVVTQIYTIVPFVRIQHVDTQRGPLERVAGLSTLVVYTAGSRGADVSIPGLHPEEARALQSRLKELAVEAEGGDAV